MERIQMGKNMAGKYALEEIANISGLSLDEVKKLKAERTV